MGKTTLLDTNIAIYLTKGGLPELVKKRFATYTQEGFNISVTTKIELLGYAFPTEQERIVTTAFVDASSVFGLSDDIVDKTIEVRSKHKIKLPDAIIAATALVYDLTLITRNMSDFVGIDGLVVVNPFDV